LKTQKKMGQRANKTGPHGMEGREKEKKGQEKVKRRKEPPRPSNVPKRKQVWGSEEAGYTKKKTHGHGVHKKN